MAKKDIKEQPVLRGVEVAPPLKDFSFPNFDGKGANITVRARTIEEALIIVRKGVTK